MNNDCVIVDELLLEIADYANNDQEMAAEKLKRLCATSRGVFVLARSRPRPVASGARTTRSPARSAARKDTVTYLLGVRAAVSGRVSERA